MTFKLANQKNVNPLFRKGGGYKSNCQSCVAVFEARLRGYNIEAKPMERHTVAVDCCDFDLHIINEISTAKG